MRIDKLLNVFILLGFSPLLMGCDSSEESFSPELTSAVPEQASLSYGERLERDISELLPLRDAVRAGVEKKDDNAADNAAHDAVYILDGMVLDITELDEPDPPSAETLKPIKAAANRLRKAFHGIERHFHSQDDAHTYQDVAEEIETTLVELQELQASLGQPADAANADSESTGDAEPEAEESPSE